MKSLKLLAVAVFAAGAVALLVYQLGLGSAYRAPTYDWQCSKCQYQFRLPVRNAAADLPIIACPKCRATAAERIMHFQCRKCWHKYDLRGSNATRGHIACPDCSSGSARDLDHLIPGDDDPVEGGKPYPGK